MNEVRSADQGVGLYFFGRATKCDESLPIVRWLPNLIRVCQVHTSVNFEYRIAPGDRLNTRARASGVWLHDPDKPTVPAITAVQAAYDRLTGR